MKAKQVDDGSLEAASNLHRAGRLLEAEALYRNALRAQRGNFAVLHRLGICLHQSGKLDEAARVLGQAVKARPSEALAHLSLAEALRVTGRHDEALAAYQRAMLLAPRDPLPHLGRAAALEAMQRHADALESYRQAQALAPDNLDTLVGQGNCQLMLGQPALALDVFDAVLSQQPGHRLAAANRAVALTQLRRPAEALAAFDALLAERPDEAALVSNRGNALFGLDRLVEALQCQDRALALQPSLLSAQISRAATLILLNRLEEAAAVLDAVVAIHPAHADARRDRAMVLLTLGRFDEALPEFEWREAGLRGNGGPAAGARRDADIRPRRWLGLSPSRDDLEGRSILLYTEQGHGDTVQFARYAALLAAAGARVVLRVQPALVSLARRIPGVAAAVAEGAATPDTDLVCPLMSLPFALGTTLQTIPAVVPYVHADARGVEHWRSRLGDDGRLRVGIAWSGSPGHINDHRRSIALARWAPLLGRDAQFLALQSDVRPADAPALQALPMLGFFGEDIADFEDSAALIALCDLVICVDTAVAHLAGAMNKPVWLLLPFAPDWRWMMARTDSPWYPGMRLFRQPAPGDWDAVLESVALALDARIAEAPTAAAPARMAQVAAPRPSSAFAS
jgi:tetratricopeptide (TPR) repeat protein